MIYISQPIKGQFKALIYLSLTQIYIQITKNKTFTTLYLPLLKVFFRKKSTFKHHFLYFSTKKSPENERQLSFFFRCWNFHLSFSKGIGFHSSIWSSYYFSDPN
jgi:hypothetical protein